MINYALIVALCFDVGFFMLFVRKSFLTPIYFVIGLLSTMAYIRHPEAKNLVVSAPEEFIAVGILCLLILALPLAIYVYKRN